MAELNGGAKAFGGIMAVLAILGTTIGAIAAIVRPINDRLRAVEATVAVHVVKDDHPIKQVEQLEQLRVEVFQHEASTGHPKIIERVKALETNNVRGKHADRLIRMLWFKSYGEEMPAVNNEGH